MTCKSEVGGGVAPTLIKLGGHVPPLPPRLLRHWLPVRDFRVIDTGIISDMFVRVSATSFILVHL